MTPVQFDETKVWYHGQRQRAAILLCGAHRVPLSLADTARCAVDLDAAKRTLAAKLPNIATGAEHELQAHCRKLVKWKERKPRY